MINKTIVALDNMNLEQARLFLKINGEIQLVKIGMEMFYGHGQNIVNDLVDDFNVGVFLDLKLHDIPNTVSKAIKSLQGLPIKFLTIHAIGGEQMIRAAMEAKRRYLPNTMILGVSYLTSLSENHFKNVYGLESNQIDEAFNRVFKVGLEEKIDGFILSGHELPLLKELAAKNNMSPIKICPGIRFEDEIDSGALQDQKRVMDPKLAFKSGADYLVMGRSLTQAKSLEQRINQLKALSN
jgi:orotidine-5'-phosphate decarboxylase